jgi:hypothetical protein
MDMELTTVELEEDGGKNDRPPTVVDQKMMAIIASFVFL